MFFVPWVLVKAWIKPLPDTVQEQVEEVAEFGFDGVVVYVNQGGKKPAFYAAGWKNRENKIPADPNSFVGIFLRALNDGSLFENGEQEIYSSLYEYDHTGLIPGYQSIAKYHKDIDAVVVQFTNTTDFEGYNWNLSEISYNRIVKILRRGKR